MASFKDSFWGPTGFDELRHLVKQGADFNKELAAIAHERAELEAAYGKGLAKLALRTSRAARDAYGTTAQAWLGVSEDMECEGELHRALSVALLQEVHRALRTLHEAQAPVRKALEAAVDRKARLLRDRRSAQLRAKRQAHERTRDRERLLAPDSSSNKDGTEVSSKLEAKRRRSEELFERAHREYYAASVSTERVRQEWQQLRSQAAQRFQVLEEERLSAARDALQRYVQLLDHIGPSREQSLNAVQRVSSNVDICHDIQEAIQERATGPDVPEQLLPDFYAEDLENPMQPDRRRQALEALLQMLMRDLETERKGKQGVENLAKVFQESPKFGSADAQIKVNENLKQLRLMLAFLEASRHKVQCVLMGLESRPRPHHPLAAHLELRRDRHGLPQTVLKVPPWVGMREADVIPESPVTDDRSVKRSPSGEREPADGWPDTSTDTEDDAEQRLCLGADGGLHQCRALYDYSPQQDDELPLNVGDIITLHTKTEEGWWYGEVGGTCGLFPATYVEELL
ncbi:nostrin-like isoform X2 [Ornithodoros turicata]